MEALGLELHSHCVEIPLTTRVQGMYCKLQIKCFSHSPMSQVQSMQAINQREKNEIVSVTYSKD